MNKIIKNFFVIFIFLFFNSIFAYRLPTDFSPDFISLFGQFSNDYFQKGIVINNKQDKLVRAINSGYITRIIMDKEKNAGSVYIKHFDGHISAYHNLASFSEKINSVLKLKGCNILRDYFDFTISDNSLTVDKSEVIGFAKISSNNQYLIYFDISNQFNENINPFLLINFTDNDFPVIENIFLEPADCFSFVNSKSEPLKISCIQSAYSYKKGEFVFTNPKDIFMFGKIKIKLQAYDIVNSATKLNIYSIKLYLNNDIIFSILFDKLNFNQFGNQQGIIYDLDKSNSEDNNFVYNLFANSHSKINFNNFTYNIENYLNLFNLSYGNHNLKIEVSDFNKNISYVNLPFYYLPENEIGISISDKLYTAKIPISVFSKNNVNLQNVSIYVSSDFVIGNFEKVTSSFVKNNSFFYEYDLTHYPFNKILFMVNCEDIYGRKSNSPSSQLIYVLKNQAIDYELRDLRYDLTKYENTNFVKLEISTNNLLKNPPEISIFQKDNLINKNNFIQTKPKYFSYFINYDSFNNGKYISEILLEDFIGNNKKFIYDFDIKKIQKKSGGTVSSSDNKLFLTIEPNEIFEDTIFYNITILNKNNFFLQDGLKFASEIYQIKPTNMFYNNPQYLQIRTNLFDGEDLTKVGLYQFNNLKKKWEWLDNKIDNRWICAYIKYNGIFALIKDDIKPEIISFHPFGKINNPLEPVYIIVNDSGSGINIEDVYFKIDNKKKLVKYEKEFNKFYFIPEAHWKKGEHIVEFFVVDKAGNQSAVKIYTFEY
ncbi:MAG TPA: hypothetical protein PLD27_06565 [bacterium]|nr:hypothetical protein [bacterium]HOL46561.1 hypothetical protein [bacterium]HPQ17868.1 hypothetical protein [bacterium]